MFKQKGYTMIELTIVIVWLLAIGGYIANIVKIVGTIADPVTGLFVFRCVGVVAAPLGAVLGFL